MTDGGELRVLLVDDERDFATATGRLLEGEAPDLVVETATSAAAALERLTDPEAPPIDCVVSDFRLGETDGLSLLADVRDHDPALPFIIYTGKGSESVASEAISAGVTDYVEKAASEQRYATLANRIENAVENRRVRERAERERQRFRALIEASSDVLLVLDRDGTVTYAAPSIERTLGRDPADVEGDHYHELVYEADHPVADEAFEALAAAPGEAMWVQFRLVDADGDRVPVEVRGRNRFEDPAVEGIVANARDVSERRERERRIEAILERSPWPIYLKDAEGRYQLVNEAAAELFDLEVADFEGGTTDADLFDDATAAKIRERDEQVLETGEVVEYESTREIDGETLHLRNVKAPYVVEDEVAGVVGFSLDVTELREREAELRAERDHVAALFENIGDAVIEYELDGVDPVIRRVNPAFEEVFGYDAETVEDEFLDDFVVGPERETEAEELNEYVANGNALATEVTRLTDDGEREFRLVSVPIEDDGAATRGYAIYSDITALKEREQELRRQNERLEEFASVVSHDLQNPLMVANGARDLLERDGEANPEHVDTLARALDRMDQLLEDLLTLARSGQAVEEFGDVDIAQVTRSAWATVDTADATLECDCTATIRADASRTRQLFENLFRNAVDHAGADVTVTVDAVEGGFCVGDDGPGVDPELLDRVFESGVSTSDEGTGFGLAIVETIAEAHGWEISVGESNAGGARFTVTGVEVVEG